MSPEIATPRAPAAGAPRLTGHIPALDGIRGLAVLMVMLYHFCIHSRIAESTLWLDHTLLRLPRSGWIGVDLFFVLSGFLITGILWDTRDSPNYFRRFYIRRFLRIFPLYYAFLAVRFLVIPLLVPALDVDGVTELLYWTYLPNLVPVLAHVSDAVGAKPLGLFHFWSLAVEEQFYLVWPVLVWKLSRTRLLRLCAIAIVTAPLIRLGLSLAFEPMAGYIVTIARLDALAIGAFLALAARGGSLEQLRRNARPVLAVSAAIVAGFILLQGNLKSWDLATQGIAYSAVAFGAGALLVQSLYRPGIFGSESLQFLGRHCYGLYVFNGPIANVLGTIFPLTIVPSIGGSLMPGLLVLTAIGFSLNVAVAWLSKRYFEDMFNSLKHRFEYERAPVPAPALSPANPAVHA